MTVTEAALPRDPVLHRSGALLRAGERRAFRSAGVLLALLCVGAVRAQQSEPPAANRVMPEVIEQFSADTRSLDETYTISFAPSHIVRFERFYQVEMDRLAALNFNALPQEDKVDYVAFKTLIVARTHQLAFEKQRAEQMEPLLPYAGPIEVLIDQKRMMQRPDAEKTAATLAGLITAMHTAQQQLDPGKAAVQNEKIDPVVANRAVMASYELQQELHTWYQQYDGYDPAFTWWVALPYQRFDAALTAYIAFMKAKLIGIAPEDKTTIIGDPIGRPALLADLADNLIPYTPEELIAIAQTEYDWCMREMLKASHEMGYGDNWHAALEKVKEMHAPPGEQPEVIRNLVVSASEFLKKNDLVTVPPLADETWRMIMMTPERQLVNPFFTGGDEISVSYPTDTMTYEQREMSMRGNSTPLSHATAFHEMIPGHFLQFYMAARYSPYRREFETPFWHEGNSLWWEMLLWDKGFDTTPAERVGALMWRMHRSARVMFTMNFHLGKWTPQQCVQYLIANVGWEPDNATAEVRRSFDGSVSPLYQSAYLMGGLQFRALHHELVDSHKMTNRQFHDAILHENSMPIELLRADLEHLPLSPDYRTQWKFYGEHPTHP